MSVSRMRRLLLDTPYFSQNRSSVRNSLSLSKIETLYSRGCFFNDLGFVICNLWFVICGLGLTNSLEIKRQFQARRNQTSSRACGKLISVNYSNGRYDSLLELRESHQCNSRSGVDPAAVSEIDTGIKPSEVFFGQRYSITYRNTESGCVFGFRQRHP